MSTLETPDPLTYAPGPALEPSADLLAWLRDESTTPDGEARRLRVPVVARSDDGFALSIGETFIGVSGATEAADSAVVLKLDDSALGIPLLVRLRDRCPPGQSWCAVWVEGTWGERMGGLQTLLALPSPMGAGLDPSGAGGAAPWPFAVSAVGEVVELSTGDVPRLFVAA